MSDSNISGESSILEERRRKLEELREQNIAYINNYIPANSSKDLHEAYGHLDKEDLESKKITNLSLAGRIVLKRVMGNASFVTIRDGSGDIQAYITKNNINPDLYKSFKTWDLGDIIGVSGNLFKTKTEELTIEAHSIILITKALRPMPEKHKGLADIEIKYRQRYLDLMSSPESKEVFEKRSRIVSSVRSTMLEDGFLEVETPMMHSIPGGAVARPFVTQHNALDRELFLRIAPELHLKRLLIGGFEKVFEINRSFRNEGLSTKHNPEFTMLEFYAAFATFDGTLDFTKNIIKTASEAIGNKNEIEWDGDEFKKIDIDGTEGIALDNLPDQCLVFVNTRRSAEAQAKRLGMLIGKRLKNEEIEKLKEYTNELKTGADEVTSVDSNLTKLIERGVAYHPVSYTHLTLPTKRIV
mgnify:FL=1